ncbi:uncharacterized protein DS421_5g169390 [Arachis hypogaea]|nr:uncharacterized protein DS421_5g169390 [Arachis hypogaea]
MIKKGIERKEGIKMKKKRVGGWKLYRVECWKEQVWESWCQISLALAPIIICLMPNACACMLQFLQSCVLLLVPLSLSLSFPIGIIKHIIYSYNMCVCFFNNQTPIIYVFPSYMYNIFSIRKKKAQILGVGIITNHHVPSL